MEYASGLRNSNLETAELSFFVLSPPFPVSKGRLLPPGFDAHLGDLSWGHFGIKMHKPVMIHDLHHVSDVFDLCHGVYAMLSPYRPHPQVPLGMPGTGSCAIYLIQKKALL